jgi:serine/threonine-protein kinase
LGQYVVQDFIGEGAMGVVFRAYHPQLERVGAVKVLNGLGGDPQSTARFRREAQAIAHLRHPNIVNVFDFGEQDGLPYMIVEYVEGGNLSARLQHGRLDGSRAIRYLTGIADAIDYAHSRGIVHRDVKPANILMTNSDTPILADFGLVKLMLTASIKSQTGVATGTPAYMAPEQVTGEELGPAADRYSFAILAYQMLTGRIPFSDGGVLEVMYAQVHSAPTPPSAFNPELGPAVDTVLLRGLAKDPKARWATCGEMVAALVAALATAPPRTAAAAAPTGTLVMPPPVPAGFAPPRARAAAPQSPGAIAAPPSDLPDIRYVPGHGARVIKRRRGVPRFMVWIGVAVAVLVVLGTSGALVYLALQPAISVAAASAHPGDQVVVTARNVPGGQTGEIHAFGTSVDFTAGGSGQVSVLLAIPITTPPGSYTVSLCWDGSCYATTSIQVLAGVAIASPPAESSPSPSPSVQGTQLLLTVVPRTGVVPGRTVLTLTASGLAPGGAGITVAQASLRQSFDALVATDGKVTKKFVLSAQLGWARTDALVTICDAQYRCTAPVDITIG